MALTAAAVKTSSSHSISNLTYRIFAGSLDLFPHVILGTRTCDWHGFRVSFFVLGASHAVVLEREGQIATETLTCGPIRASAELIAEARADMECQISVQMCGLNVRSSCA